MIVLVLLAAFGVAWIAGFSVISLPIRKWLGGFQREIKTRQLDGSLAVETVRVPGHLPLVCKLIECPGCLGFHLGWIYELILGPTGIVGPKWFQVIVMGAAFAAFNYTLGKLTRLIN
jgi:hypothetical protein